MWRWKKTSLVFWSGLLIHFFVAHAVSFQACWPHVHPPLTSCSSFPQSSTKIWVELVQSLVCRVCGSFPLTRCNNSQQGGMTVHGPIATKSFLKGSGQKKFSNCHLLASRYKSFVNTNAELRKRLNVSNRALGFFFTSSLEVWMIWWERLPRSEFDSNEPHAAS